MLHKTYSALIAGGLMIGLAGCQMAPTRVGESQKREYALVVDKAQRPLAITGVTVVLDTRSAFDYGLNRVENSLHFPWASLAEKEESGELMRDPRKAALKLALAGMNPGTPVIVVGYGAKGRGEEGRLAWNLLYLGFQDVQVASVDLFRKNWTQTPTPAPQNVAPWTPDSRDRMIVGAKEFHDLASNPRVRMEKRVWILDVRSTQEYFNRDPKAKATPDIGALNIEWKEFFTEEGRPKPSMRAKLASLGLQPKDRVIVVSNRGVRSSAAAYALTALGFSNIQNFIGGWRAF